MEITDQIGEGTALADEVIHHEIAPPRVYRAAEQGLMGQAPKAVRAGVTHGIELDDGAVDTKRQPYG